MRAGHGRLCLVVLVGWGAGLLPSDVAAQPFCSNPTFALPRTDIASGGAGVSELALADVNLDGRLDLIATNSASSNVSRFLGTGSGTLGPFTLFSTGAGSQPAGGGDGRRAHGHVPRLTHWSLGAGAGIDSGPVLRAGGSTSATTAGSYTRSTWPTARCSGASPRVTAG
jgi:hypothetical protein